MSNTAVRLSPAEHWRRPLLALSLYVLALLMVYWPTVLSMVDIWYRSETFAHGFIIAPVSLWLVWQLRHELAGMTPKIQLWFILPMIGVGVLWLMSWLVDVMVVRQLSFVLLLILGVCALLGTAISRRLLFPLAFLLFMVPMGENLIAPMMDFTAASTVWMVRQTGIPVYQEGLFFSLPSGNWSVVEACSGIRYLIASVTLGCLYAYLMYTSLTKRLIFVAVAIIVPVIANSLRAYFIVMIGHLSGMTLAVGVDHLIYGWFFFGIVIFLMFLAGSFFRDAKPDTGVPATTVSDTALESPHSRGSPHLWASPHSWTQAGSAVYMAAVGIVVSALVWPLVPALLPDAKPASADSVFTFSAAPHGWQEVNDPGWSWLPFTTGADVKHKSFYSSNGAVMGLYINQYFSQTQGGELVNSLDQWIIPDIKEYQWHLLSQGSAQMQVLDQVITVEQARIKSPEAELLLWRWYRIGEYDTANPYVAKVLEALSKLAFRSTSAVRIYMVTPVRDSVDLSAANLQSFIDQLFPQLEVVLNPQQEMR